MGENSQTVTAELEMTLDRAAPEGVLTSADGHSFRFSGWTELAASIEQWRSHAANAQPRDGRHDAATPPVEPREEP